MWKQYIVKGTELMLNQSFDYNQLVNSPLLAYLINAANILTYIFVRWTTGSGGQISIIMCIRPAHHICYYHCRSIVVAPLPDFMLMCFLPSLTLINIAKINHDINRSMCLSIMAKLTFQIPSLMVKACLCVKFRIDASTWIRRFQIDDFQDYINLGSIILLMVFIPLHALTILIPS